MRPIKRIGKNMLSSLLEGQVTRLKKRNTITIVAVAGSVGKTSTKMAIAQLLGASKRVQFQTGNYNDRLTVPLIFFGHPEPSIFNVFAWAKILIANERQIRSAYPYDYVVVELGTDGPGQISQFAYLEPDLTVVTAVAEEHMEYFKTLDAVAAEELAVVTFSKQSLLNTDDVSAEYLPATDYASYGTQDATYSAVDCTVLPALRGQTFTVQCANGPVTVSTNMLGEQGLKICLAAVAVGDMLGLSADELMQGIAAIKPSPGRMQVLQGIKGAAILDDTYNASPIAVRAALDVLYACPAMQRIAILGSMNEMGEASPQMHAAIGEYCDPQKLNQVVVIGKEASAYLAPSAEARGCKVTTFAHPLEAGRYVLEQLQEGAVILAKGSQNGVFAEEAIVPLLANPTDVTRLVRQSAYWQAAKKANLPKLP